MSSAMERGSEVFRSNTEMVCGTPLSETPKSSFSRSVMMALVARSRTETSSRTRLEFTEKRGGAFSCDCARRFAVAQAMVTVTTRAAMRQLCLLSRLAPGTQRYIPLAYHPHRAVFKILFLPDGDLTLQPVDAFERCLNSGLAVRRRHNHRYTGFAYFQAPEAMHDRDAAHGMRLHDLQSDL